MPLLNGQVLIAGGNNGILSSAGLFNPLADTITRFTGSGQSLSEARALPVAATLANGQVLIAGGYSGKYLSSAELFSPATNTFMALAGPEQAMTEAREGAVAAALPNGEVLIAGGYNGNYLSSAELFRPATETFTKLTGSGQSLSEGRVLAFAATLPNGQVLIAAGESFGELSSAELFVPAAQAQIAGGTFGEQTIGEHSAVGVLTVMNVGAQALSINGATLAGTNPSDFTVSADGCEGVTLAFRQECTISVSFTLAAEGQASVTLTLNDNESEPAVMTLSGTGVPPIHGPQGERGKRGEKGAASATGPAGTTGHAHAQLEDWQDRPYEATAGQDQPSSLRAPAALSCAPPAACLG